MKTSFVFRRAIQAILPATLLLAACSKSDTPAPAAPDQARVQFVHDIVSASTVPVKALVGTQEVATLNYSQNSAYTGVAVGAQDIKINASQTGTALAVVNKTLAKDVNYSVFAYRSGTAAAPVAPLVTEDNLTAPASGKAKIRLVNLGIGTATLGVGLSRVQGTGFASITTADVLYGAASSFTETDAGPVAIFLTSGGAPTTPLITPNPKTLTAGKIYTVVIRGTDTPLTNDQALTVDFIENN
ncbi:hypothetical protein ACVWYF_004209 [Hymenobacter sp. UYAg731]